MGMFDIVTDGKDIEIQIKSTDDPCCFVYRLGDNIRIPDGLHLAYEGWFVVRNGMIIAIGEKAYNKWGGDFYYRGLIEKENPIAAMVKEIKEDGTKSA